ncbi:MAG: hypothetical protein IJ538_00850 [Clostridia bacterium]|nr:hypothetical protein [Clostridia bacterium]
MINKIWGNATEKYFPKNYKNEMLEVYSGTNGNLDDLFLSIVELLNAFESGNQTEITEHIHASVDASTLAVRMSTNIQEREAVLQTGICDYLSPIMEKSFYAPEFFEEMLKHYPKKQKMILGGLIKLPTKNFLNKYLKSKFENSQKMIELRKNKLNFDENGKLKTIQMGE